MGRRLLTLSISKTLAGVVLITSLTCSVLTLVLPWRVRIVYLDIVNIASGLLMKSRSLMDLIEERAFAQESARKLFSMKEKTDD